MNTKLNKLKKVVIPVAGLGTRMLPVTLSVPKEMLPLANVPIIQYIIDEVKSAGFKEIIFITSPTKKKFKDYFIKNLKLETYLKSISNKEALKKINKILDKDLSIKQIIQKEPKGLGHAILCSKKIVGKEPFAVVLPDMVMAKKSKQKNSSLKNLKVNFEKYKKTSILLGEVNKKDISKYGIAKIKKSSTIPCLGYLQEIIEKPSLEDAPSNLYAVGRYVFANDFMGYLNKVKPDNNGEVQLTSAISQYIKHRNDVIAFLLNEKLYDCGDEIGYLTANLDFSMKDKKVKKIILKHLKS